ncbi:MAG TPA: hypothetical protein PLT66_09265, partial [Bacillota bacterium]|nr:hypothetical protein [Bacillota bacterium]
MVYIILAVFCVATSFTLNKLYQKKYCSDKKSLFIFTILMSLSGGLFFFCLNGFTIRFGGFTFVTALAVAVTVAFNNFTGLIIMKHCKMSLYMSFLMTGGMLIPFLYGVIFLDEKLTALRVIAMLMLLLALFMPVVEKGGEKASRLGIILCVCVFLSNGINSTVSKIHQISPQALGTNDFSFWLY